MCINLHCFAIAYKKVDYICQQFGSYRNEKNLSTVSEEFRQKFPRLVANLVIAVVFTGISQIVSWVFNGINPDILFLLQNASTKADAFVPMWGLRTFSCRRSMRIVANWILP